MIDEVNEEKEPTSFDELNEASLALIKSYLQACNTMSHYIKAPEFNWQELLNVQHIYDHWLSEISNKPNNIWQTHSRFCQDYLVLCGKVHDMLLGKKSTPMISPKPNDRRFKAHDWHDSPSYFFIQQYYLLFVHHCLEFVQANPSKDPKIAKQISFFTHQYLNALSPTNYLLTNPEVLQRTISSKGENITLGLKNYFDDIARGHGHWSFKMTDMRAFEVGKNIAITKGSVIYQNRLMQLIQYHPTTEQVHQLPLLIIPPWINKYYILDLKERNSYVKWLVDQGLTVFMISWVNPDENYRKTSYDDYLFEGIISALDNIKEATNETKINALGFCIGGTLLASALGYMQAKNDKRIQSATFLTTLIDFGDPGEIGVFIDEEQIATLEKEMEPEGYLDGRILMMAFNLLRSNELFWPYYINNYLMGQNPFSFDLLYWNSDSTSLPAQMVSDFVRNMYMENRLSKRGALSIKGVKIDLHNVNVPCYFLSTEQDHIAPWQSTYDGAQCLQGPIMFVLGQSGHIAGVINPPSLGKYGYYYQDVNAKDIPSAQAWLQNSTLAEGSWWDHWLKWVKPRAGKQISPRIPGQGKLKVIQDAPGDYVKKPLP